MSIAFTILCAESPARFLEKKAKWLRWDAGERSGHFRGMDLSWRATSARSCGGSTITAYRAEFPGLADQAEQAIEDARAFLAPS